MIANSHPPQPPIRIACVGGGIGGLSLALGLSKRQKEGANFEFHVFEAAPQFKEIGAGVGVGPNALHAITLLGLGEPYEAIAFTHEEESGTYFRWWYGETSKIAANGGTDEIGVTPCHGKLAHTTVHRAQFLDMMIDRLPPNCASFNKRLVAYTLGDSDDLAAAPVTLHFADGTTHEADVLLGADGIKSVVRPQMLKEQMTTEVLKPMFTGTVAYRGLAPMDEMVAKIGERARKGAMFLGLNKHILIFPIQKGTVVNIVAFASNRSLSASDPVWDSDTWIVPGTKDDMLLGWDGWTDDCLAILRSISHPSKWALHELSDFPTHNVGRVVILGDAAAATLPHQGQGAGQAIESAYTLSSLLASPHLTRDNVHVALQVFNELRHDRVTKVKTTSNELGRILEFCDGTINGDRELLSNNLRDRYDWIWNWDGEAEVTQGLDMIKERLRV